MIYICEGLPVPHHTFELGDLVLQGGMTIPKAKLVYATHGQLAGDRSNAILYPTSFGAQHPDIDWLVGAAGILDPSRYFIVIPNMLGNGLSSSPSNYELPLGVGRRPLITHWDNVHAQARLLTEALGIERLALVYGWSMGAQQALHWGAIFPQRVARICAVCGSAKTSLHNHVFLEGVKAALTADPHWRGNHFTAHPVRGLRAMGRIYAGWALSQDFYRQRCFEALGFASLEDFLVRAWEGNFLRRHPDDLLSMIDTWQASDISANPLYGGDLAQALGAITARTFVMPCVKDLYFTPEDSHAEAAQMPNAEFRPLDSLWGHRAGNPVDSPQDQQTLRAAVAALLDQ
ncbi:MAG: alpha/beta fold hydrolase [Candidatus Competibacterales bacterium]